MRALEEENCPFWFEFSFRHVEFEVLMEHLAIASSAQLENQLGAQERAQDVNWAAICLEGT